MNRKKTIAVTDLDGTIVRGSLVLEFAVSAHNDGLVNLDEWLVKNWLKEPKNEGLIKDLAEDFRRSIVGKKEESLFVDQFIDKFFKNPKNFYSTFKDLKNLKKEGGRVVIISGSPSFLVAPFAEKIGFEQFSSTYYKDESGRFNGELKGMFGSEDKEEVVKELRVSSYGEIFGYGDTSSDIPLLVKASKNKRFIVDPTVETIKSLHDKGLKNYTIIPN